MLEASGGRPEDGLPVWRLILVLEIIQERLKNISNEEKREIPIVWSVMHMYGTVQLAKIVALKRDLEPELAALVCAFHDIYTLHTGKWEDHALKAEPYIRAIITEYNERWGAKLAVITDKEVDLIVGAIEGHSNKLIISDEPYAELLKDVDSFDAYLHGYEPTETSGRIPRINKVFSELSIEKSVS